MDSCLSQGYWREVKCKQPGLGFELGSPSPFLMTIAVTLQAHQSLSKFVKYGVIETITFNDVLKTKFTSDGAGGNTTIRQASSEMNKLKKINCVMEENSNKRKRRRQQMRSSSSCRDCQMVFIIGKCSKNWSTGHLVISYFPSNFCEIS